jgi:hypothetical protein
MVTALTIRPESWKDVVNDASFKSMMSETGFAAFALWNDALQGMTAQRDKLQRDLLDWESGKRTDIDLQADLNSFQASMISYVQAKREFAQNFFMVAITIATLPIGAGLSVAGKLAMVGVAGLIELAGMKAAMGNDFDLPTEIVPDVLHGSANMAMMLLGGALADRFLSGVVGAGVKTALEAAGVQVGTDFAGNLLPLVTSIEGKAGADAIRSAAMNIVVKMMAKDATQEAINSATDLLMSTTTKALQAVSIPQRALLMTASMEIVGLSSHSLATIGTSIYENLKTGKPFDMMLEEALKEAGSNLLPTAAAILVGVGLSMLTEVMTKAAESAPDAVAKTNLSNFVENQIVAPISELIQTLRQAGGQLDTQQILTLIDARLGEIARAIDGLMNPNVLAIAGVTGDGTANLTGPVSPSGGDTSAASSSSHPANPPATTSSNAGQANDGLPPAGQSNDGSSPAGKSNDGSPPAGQSNDGSPPAGQSNDGSPAAGQSSDGSPPVGQSNDGSPAADQSTAPAAPPKLPNQPINEIPESQLRQVAAATKTDVKVLQDLARLANTVKNADTMPDEFRALNNDQVAAGKLLGSKPLDEMTPSEIDTIAKGARVLRPTLEALSGAVPSEVVPLEGDIAGALRKWGVDAIKRLFVQPAIDGVTGAGNFAASGIQFIVKNGVRAIIVGGVAYVVVSALMNRSSNSNSTAGSDSSGNDGTNGGQPAPNVPQATPTFDVARNFSAASPADAALKVHKLMKEISSAGEFYGDNPNDSDPKRYITYQDLLSVSKQQSDAIVQLGWDPAVVHWLLVNWKYIHDPSSNSDYNGQDVISEDSLSHYIARLTPNSGANGNSGN